MKYVFIGLLFTGCLFDSRNNEADAPVTEREVVYKASKQSSSILYCHETGRLINAQGYAFERTMVRAVGDTVCLHVEKTSSYPAGVVAEIYIDGRLMMRDSGLSRASVVMEVPPK